MARIGYARVSTLDQDLDGQLARLSTEGCSIIRSEKVSGASREGREELATIIAFKCDCQGGGVLAHAGASGDEWGRRSDPDQMMSCGFSNRVHVRQRGRIHVLHFVQNDGLLLMRLASVERVIVDH